MKLRTGQVLFQNTACRNEKPAGKTEIIRKRGGGRRLTRGTSTLKEGAGQARQGAKERDGGL